MLALWMLKSNAIDANFSLGSFPLSSYGNWKHVYTSNLHIYLSKNEAFSVLSGLILSEGLQGMLEEKTIAVCLSSFPFSKHFWYVQRNVTETCDDHKEYIVLNFATRNVHGFATAVLNRSWASRSKLQREPVWNDCVDTFADQCSVGHLSVYSSCLDHIPETFAGLLCFLFGMPLCLNIIMGNISHILSLNLEKHDHQSEE